jgi:hypothetical protein
VILASEPVRANRAEDVEIERVFERHGPMWDIGWNVEHFPFAHDNLLSFQLEFQRALENVRNLLALVVMHRHYGVFAKKHLGDHRFFAGNDFPGDGLTQDFSRDLVPGEMGHGEGFYRIATSKRSHERRRGAGDASLARSVTADSVVDRHAWTFTFNAVAVETPEEIVKCVTEINSGVQ